MIKVHKDIMDVINAEGKIEIGGIYFSIISLFITFPLDHNEHLLSEGFCLAPADLRYLDVFEKQLKLCKIDPT